MEKDIEKGKYDEKELKEINEKLKKLFGRTLKISRVSLLLLFKPLNLLEGGVNFKVY